jgi:hypothetical protein
MQPHDQSSKNRTFNEVFPDEVAQRLQALAIDANSVPGKKGKLPSEGFPSKIARQMHDVSFILSEINSKKSKMMNA